LTSENRIPISRTTQKQPSFYRLERDVRHGTLFLLGAQIASQLVSFSLFAVLYRLMGPEPYGFLGMCLPLILILRSMSTLGLNVVTVQRPQKSHDEINVFFWLLQAGGLVSAAVVAGCGLLVGWIGGAPAAGWVFVAMSGTVVLYPLSIQHQALLERELKFKPLVIARLTAQTVGGILAIVTALMGHHVGALVVQQYAELLVLAALVWIFESWRPGWPRHFSKVARIVPLGIYWSLSSFVLGLSQQLDKVLLVILAGGSPTGLAMVGMYTQAFQLMLKPIHLVNAPVLGVMLPALSRAAHEKTLYQTFVTIFYRMVSLILLPCGVGLFLISEDLILAVGGSAWMEAGPILKLLAPAILVQGYFNMAATIFSSVGRFDRLFVAALVVTSCMLLSFVVGAYCGLSSDSVTTGPALGLAASYSLGLLATVVPYTLFSWRTAGVRGRPIISGILRPFVSACLMGVLVYFLQKEVEVLNSLPAVARLALLVGVGASFYTFLVVRDIKSLWVGFVEARYYVSDTNTSHPVSDTNASHPVSDTNTSHPTETQADG